MTHDREPPLPDLPPEVDEALQEARRTSLPEGFEARLSARLRSADASSSERPSGQGTLGRRILRNLFWVPTLAGMAVGVHLAFFSSIADRENVDALIHRSEEVRLQLPLEGTGWVPLDLWTHEHEEDLAHVRVVAPENVRVRIGSRASNERGEVVCEEQQCAHRFAHPTHRTAARIHIGVEHPGSYDIDVHHESSNRGVRERFVVHATR